MSWWRPGLSSSRAATLWQSLIVNIVKIVNTRQTVVDIVSITGPLRSGRPTTGYWSCYLTATLSALVIRAAAGAAPRSDPGNRSPRRGAPPPRTRRGREFPGVCDAVTRRCGDAAVTRRTLTQGKAGSWRRTLDAGRVRRGAGRCSRVYARPLGDVWHGLNLLFSHRDILFDIQSETAFSNY